MFAGQVIVQATTQEVAQTFGVMMSENLRTLPVSPAALSLTFSTQLPLGSWPSKADSGLAGVKVPV